MTAPRRGTRPLATRVLPNGLTLLVREDRKAPVVAVNLWVGAGSNHETDDVLGWSHGIEHMMFKGTARRGPGVAAREVRDAGGVLNAGTGYESTNYYVTIPSRNVRVAFGVQADAVRNSLFDPAELDRERRVIIEENRMYRDQPSGFGHTWERLLALAFRASPYRRPIGGPDESLRSAPREAILAYRDRMYVPANAVLSVAGEIAPGEAFALAEEAYGGWPGRTAPEVRPPVEPPQEAPRAATAPGPVARCYVKLGWHAGPETDRDTYATLVFLRILARGRSSRLHEELLEKRGLLSEVGVLQETGSSESFFVLDLVTDAPKIDALIPAVFDEIDRVRDGGVTEEDLERAKNFMVRSHVLGQETVEAQAHALGHAFLRGDVTLADRFPEIVESIGREDVRRAAERFGAAGCSILVHHPEGERVPDVEALVGGWAGAARASAAPGASVTIAAGAAPPAPAVVLHRGGERRFERILLDNGVTLLVKRRPALPSVAFGAFVRAGTAHERAEISGLNALAHRTMVKGTRGRTSERIARESEMYGAAIVPLAGADVSGFSARTITRFFDRALDVFADVLREPSFSEREVERERALAIAEIRQEEDEPFHKGSREFQRALFGTDPYALPPGGDEETVRTLTRAQLAEWYARVYRAGGLLLVAVGDVEPGALAERVRGALGGLSAGALPPPPPLAPDAGPWPREVVIEKAVHQEVILLGVQGPPATSEDAYPLHLLSAVMSGMGNRLFVALRDREGLCYSTGLSYRALARAGVLVAYVGTAPENEARAREGLERELWRVLEAGVGEEELDRARNALIGQHAIARQTGGAEAALAARYEILGLGHEEVDRFEERLLAVTAEDVARAASRWLRLDRATAVVVRPRREPSSAPRR